STVEAVQRNVSAYYDNLTRSDATDYYGQSTLYTNLNQIQGIFNEPSSNSLQSSMDQFFSAFQTLSTNPQSNSARQTVISQAGNMVDSFNQLTNQLQTMSGDLQGVVSGQLQEVNGYAEQISALNQQIAGVLATGQQPNQLMDQRGELLDKLAKLGNVQTTENTNGSYNVTFGSQQIVAYSSTSGYSYATFSEGSGVSYSGDLQNGTSSLAGLTVTTTSATGTAPSQPESVSLNLTQGEMTGNILGMTQANGFISTLGNLANALGNGVNNLLEQGYSLNSNVSGSSNGAQLLFLVSNGNLSVNPNVTPSDIQAATTSNAPGNGQNALAVAQLQQSTTLTYNVYSSSGSATSTLPLGATPDGYYTGLVSGLGAATKQAENQQNTNQALYSQAQTLQQSVSGVNLNNSTADITEWQNVYDAASRFLQIQDEMIQTMIQEV
ncbi:MAG: flagellar hook-associated protein FlgK, partial [Firmicutes bacterium]|nr:flagellar hook-associated protein FlgK [Bacillota bacterium]